MNRTVLRHSKWRVVLNSHSRLGSDERLSSRRNVQRIFPLAYLTLAHEAARDTVLLYWYKN